MGDHKKYLAQQLLAEDKLVTYRLLSRAMKVHVNTAKEMLYEFYKWQNDKKPGTIHATYIVYGTMKKGQNGDVEMTGTESSEDKHVSFSDEVPSQTLSLVKEEHLQDVLAQYDEVTSIHIYSLAPHPLKDLQILADSAREVFEASSSEDARTSAKLYGTIFNPNMRKRERRGQAPRSAAKAPSSAPVAETKTQAKQEAKSAPSTSTSTKEDPKTAQPPKKEPATKKSSAAPSLKRNGSSGIGQMFAKAAAKPKKTTTATAEIASKASSATASGAEEASSMAMSDDGEDDAEPAANMKREDSTTRQTRKDRQAKLRQMMEESEDEEEAESRADTPAEEPMEEDEAPASEPEPEPKAEEPAEVVSSTGDGRRRGRRRITRKKQIMDEEGYLVTIQEPGWESFSEEEAPPSQAAAKAKPAAAKPAAKAKKPAAGKGGAQGNIMSFFGKK